MRETCIYHFTKASLPLAVAGHFFLPTFMSFSLAIHVASFSFFYFTFNSKASLIIYHANEWSKKDKAHAVWKWNRRKGWNLKSWLFSKNILVIIIKRKDKSPHPQPWLIKDNNCQFPHAVPRAARSLRDLRCVDRVTN